MSLQPTTNFVRIWKALTKSSIRALFFSGMSIWFEQVGWSISIFFLEASWALQNESSGCKVQLQKIAWWQENGHSA